MAGGRRHLTQGSNILGGGDDPTEPDKPGTVALGGEPGWDDYQLSVRLRSGDDDAIGVVVRRLDDDNWYRFSLDHEGGYRRLVKRVAGAVTVLWEDDGSFTVGEPFDVSVAVEGDRIRGWVDGSLLFDVSDGDLTHGRVGFYSWANTDARFSQVLVTDLRRRVGRWTIHDDGTTTGHRCGGCPAVPSCRPRASDLRPFKLWAERRGEARSHWPASPHGATAAFRRRCAPTTTAP